MRQSLPNLLVLLLTLVLAPAILARPRDYFGLGQRGEAADSKAGPTGGPIAGASDPRQATRTSILTRTRMKETRRQVKDAHNRWLGPGMGVRPGALGRVRRNEGRALQARASVVPRAAREACDDGWGREGWARYRGWELEFDDIPGGSLWVSEESYCVSACLSYGTGCAGAQYIPNREGPACFLKAPYYHTGTFTNQTDEAQVSGTVLNLVGGCEAWAGIVPDDMDAVCCGA